MKPLVVVGMFVIATVSLLNGQMYDPFQKTQVMEKSVKPSLLLMPLPPLLGSAPMFTQTVATAVLNNKAFINGKWYKVGDKVNAQEITSIQPNFVALKEGNRLTMLGVGTQEKVLQTKESQ